MKEEVKELTKERDKIFSELRQYFGVTDPKFQPASLSFSEGSSSLYIYCLRKINYRNYQKEIPVSIKWIEDEIKKLESINKKLEEL